jgi:DUF4097 and DUF4098 domain-containing protein YvlB
MRNQTVCWALIAAAVLSACGGGGGESTSTPAQSGANPSDRPIVAGRTSPLVIPNPPVLPTVQVPVGSNTFTCNNVRIGAQQIDTVFVPAGATCVLDGTSLQGSLKAESGAVVDARNVRINGDVQTAGVASVVLAGASSVSGSVQIKQGASAIVVGTQINGNLQFDLNRGALIAEDNRVTGSIQVVENTGGVTLNTNVANGNLQCKQNQPAPTGSGNRAALLEDQCASLGGNAGEPGPTPTPSPTTPPTGQPLPPQAVLPPAVNPAGSNTFTCQNVQIGAVDIDSVFVPPGATCVLNGTRLVGSIKVDQGAAVDARDIRMNGDMQADGAASVVVGGASQIRGSVQVKQGGTATILGARINGSIQFFANRGQIVLQDNASIGNIQLEDNIGGVTLNANSTNGNLQCKQNQPAPVGSGNRAALKEDQCKAL